MMKSFKPHLELLPPTQQTLWPKLAPCKDLGFTLYGGTALALQLGHRVSVDFDFFSHEVLDDTKENILLAALPFLAEAKRTQNSMNTRTYVTGMGVSLSFFGKINFGRVGIPLVTEDGVLQVASLEDLMATKLAVVQQRVESKDYRDIAALLHCGLSLEKGLACAQALYGEQFSPAECVKTLCFFEGGDLASLPQKDKELILNTVKNLQVGPIGELAIVSKQLTTADDHPSCPSPEEEDDRSPR